MIRKENLPERQNSLIFIFIQFCWQITFQCQWCRSGNFSYFFPAKTSSIKQLSAICFISPLFFSFKSSCVTSSFLLSFFRFFSSLLLRKLCCYSTIFIACKQKNEHDFSNCPILCHGKTPKIAKRVRFSFLLKLRNCISIAFSLIVQNQQSYVMSLHKLLFSYLR